MSQQHDERLMPSLTDVARDGAGIDDPSAVPTPADNGAAPAAEAAAPAPEPTAHPLVFEIKDLAVYYGSFRAVREVGLGVRQHEITAFIGPSGCGKTTVLRCLNRMNDLIPTARVEGSIMYHDTDLYGANVSAAEVRRHIGMVFQRPNPVPEEHLRQRGVRAQDQRRPQEGRTRRHHRAFAAERGPVGRGEGPAEVVGPRDVGWSAAAPVHRPGHRRRARGGADGRAVLGPRPDRHRPHRGADARAQGPLHDRDRHPQHAAGGPGERQARPSSRPRFPSKATAVPGA